uniref:G-protein coupled receptors family 1 profile domain-containing protein n=1 Tax=Cairina moschata TaxID=8855 RepID=A0A8C3GFY0_CAIMO
MFFPLLYQATSTLTFFLGGFPAWESTQMWSAVLLCSVYLLVLLGNWTVLAIIKAEQSLHAPMYLLLAMLAVADLEISSCTCFSQMFFIHSFTDIESATILSMAFDRYMAICHLLRYSSILTNSVITKICVAIVIRTILFQFPLTILLTQLCFSRANIIKHADSDTKINSACGLFVLLSTLGLDLLFVLLSYLLILKTILNLATWRERLKALNNCISHVCAVLLFFIPMICLSMMHRFGKHVSPQVYTFTANLHFLAPPILNPIVYSMKTNLGSLWER